MSVDRRKLVYKIRGEDRYDHPLNSWDMKDGTCVAIYQGSRGDRPDLDFILKYLEPSKRLRTPSHTHWVVDLLIKSEFDRKLTGKFVCEMIEKYDELLPFGTKKERKKYQLVYPSKMVKKYSSLSDKGGFSIDTLTVFIELFSKCEKQTSGAFMFKDLLDLIKQYTEGRKDFYQVIGTSKRV